MNNKIYIMALNTDTSLKKLYSIYALSEAPAAKSLLDAIEAEEQKQRVLAKSLSKKRNKLKIRKMRKADMN